MKLIIRHLIDTLVTMEDIDMDEIDDYFRELRGERRSRTSARTPGSGRRRKTPKTPASRGRSRSRSTVARKLKLPSGTKSMSVDRPARLYREAVKLTSAPKDERTKFDIYHLNKGKSLDEIDRMWKRRNSGKYKLNTRKVRHKNARSTLNKMPRGGKPYAGGRKSMRKPRGAYRGAVMPRWAKGETKHILAGDGCDMAIATQTNTALVGAASGIAARDKHREITIGNAAYFSLNPIAQGSGQYQRNGRSVDGTYLRIQGHIFNAAGAHDNVGANDNVGGTNTSQKAYVRMLVLAVKGNTNTGGAGKGPDGTADVRGKAPLLMSNLFKRIDGSITGFTAATNEVTAVASVRTLQLPVNKALYTVLSDQKMSLASTNESFGSSDRLFDFKIPLKQKSVWASAEADTFEKNQLVFVVMTVDPACNNTIPVEKIHLEFESKYSYKDF
jgi:hypothetical protein